MEKYDYRQALRHDIRYYLEENGIQATQETDDEIDALRDELWLADSVTGNASGSYTFSTWQAEENLCHNWDLLAEALYIFGYDVSGDNPIEKGAEWCDVTIRCYLLDECLIQVLSEMTEESTQEYKDALPIAQDIVSRGLYSYAVMLMDDEIREQVHADHAPCPQDRFIAYYMTLHEEKYGAPFVVN